ncbi:MAG: lysophospholipase [Spirochaetaceae bacterium]|jgi:alpha-beta hydrolase superfamily lysophospholipase|nr:lysophospholipase [Spirochaetaceae bacterium]
MAITYINKTFPSSEGHCEITYAKWADDAAQPRGLLVIAHGMAEYIDRYDAFARFMAENGFAVYGEDHLGHGKTCPQGTKDEYRLRGHFGKKDGRYNLVEDMRKLCMIAREDYPGIPLILMGHSMGSFIARLFTMRYSKELDGAIFMGTAGTNPAAGPGTFLVNCIGSFKGETYYSPFIEKLLGSASNLPGAKTPFDWLNRIDAEVQNYINDKDCGFPFTISGYRELLKMMQEINAKGWAEGIRNELPILVISGEGDPIGAMGKGIREVCDALKAGGQTDVAIKLYPEARHEILLEQNKDEVFADIFDWSKKITS